MSQIAVHFTAVSVVGSNTSTGRQRKQDGPHARALDRDVAAGDQSAAMRLVCPAKINLHLRVGRRRPDGFHPLLSWMTTVGLFDTLTVDDPSGANPPGRERAGAARILLLSSDLPGLPDDGSNLVVRAAEALAHAIAGSVAGDVRDDTAGPSSGGRRAGAKSGSVTSQPRAA